MNIEISALTGEQGNTLLELDEGHFCDLKGKAIKPANLSKTVSALGNTSGGEIYIGIDEAFHAHGVVRSWDGFENVEAANAHIQVIEEMLPLGAHYSASFLSWESGPGLVLQLGVFKNPEVLYASNGKAYIRRGAQNLPVDSGKGLERLKYDKGLSSYEDQRVDMKSADITNSLTMLEFLISVVPTAEPLAWLEKQRLIIDDQATVAGILLFVDEPQIYLPKRSGVKIYRYSTKESEGERDTLVFDPITIEGPTYSLIYDVVAKVTEIIESIEKLGPSGLEPVEYPSEALHEVITNAVLHRDYSIASDIHVRIFDDRVEIENPGKLPGHISVKNILTEQFARNPKVVRLINKFPEPPNKDVGEGLNTTFEAMAKLRLTPPELEEQDNGFLVRLRHQSLASPEQMVMEYLENHDQITNSLARDLTGIRSENTMKEVFYRLRNRNHIEPVPGLKARASAWRLPATR